MYNYRVNILDGESIMFSWDEIFGTRNQDGSWDLEITGTNSDFNGDSCEQKITIKAPILR